MEMFVMIVVFQRSREQPRTVILWTDVGQIVARMGIDRLIDPNEHPETQGEEMLLVEEKGTEPDG